MTVSVVPRSMKELTTFQPYSPDEGYRRAADFKGPSATEPQTSVAHGQPLASERQPDTGMGLHDDKTKLTHGHSRATTHANEWLQPDSARAATAGREADSLECAVLDDLIRSRLVCQCRG